MSFIFPKKIKTTLKIKPIFKAPNTPPNILLIIPRDAKSAIFVNAFPRSAITTIIITKVIAKDAKEMYSGFQDTYSFRKLETKY